MPKNDKTFQNKQEKKQAFKNKWVSTTTLLVFYLSTKDKEGKVYKLFEWLFLIFYHGECELLPLTLELGHNRDNTFYY